MVPVDAGRHALEACAFCRTNLLGRADAFGDGDRISPCCTRECSHGDLIYRQGQPGTNLYSVCRGLVKLDQRLPDGGVRTVRLLRPGCVFGLEVMADSPCHHSARSVGRSKVCLIPVRTIRELAEHAPSMHGELMNEWCRALDEADFVISQLSTGAARQRVMSLLEHLCNAGDAGSMCQAPPRDDMASLLGLTPETISRTIASLKREGTLREGGGVFTIDRDQ
ncbi:MAG: Crp/Fnr family transcriptional regulator [Aquabacterium sp.]|uniref:Crp/Fnr family transcriptional regulator n=1 Tax=Aquabacterium sp. TaxID=1872578 RepID=UPI003BD07F69